MGKEDPVSESQSVAAHGEFTMGICIGVDVAKAHLDWVLGIRGP